MLSDKSTLYIALGTLVLSAGLFALGMFGYKPIMDFILAGNISPLVQFNFENEAVHRLIAAAFFVLPGLISGGSALWCSQTLRGRFTIFVCMLPVIFIVMFIRVFFLRYELNRVSQSITSTVMLPAETIHLFTMGAYAGIAVFILACMIRWIIKKNASSFQ